MRIRHAIIGLLLAFPHYCQAQYTGSVRGDLSAVTGGWVKIYDTTNSVAVSCFTVTGLDGNTDGPYYVVIIATNPKGTDTSIEIWANADFEDSNYRTQRAEFFDTTTGFSRLSLSRLCNHDNGDGSLCHGIIHIDPGGVFRWQSSGSGAAVGSVDLGIYAGAKFNTVANLTRLDFSTAIVDAFGVGTRVMVYKIR